MTKQNSEEACGPDVSRTQSSAQVVEIERLG